MTERSIPKIISVDDHVVEPPHLFDRWLPQKFQDHPDKPRVERRGRVPPDFTLQAIQAWHEDTWIVRRRGSLLHREQVFVPTERGESSSDFAKLHARSGSDVDGASRRRQRDRCQRITETGNPQGQLASSSCGDRPVPARRCWPASWPPVTSPRGTR